MKKQRELEFDDIKKDPENKKNSKRKPNDFKRDDYWDYCDNCGHKLISRKCEMICPQCGFFRSCSEP